MLIAVSIFAILAAVLHIFIFYLESFAWETKARDVFGTSKVEAAATKEMAFNQGFYNLFLAIITLAGVAGLAFWSTSVGLALIIAGAGSMLAAAAVLFFTSPDKRSAAIKQGLFPLITVILALLVLVYQ